MDRSLDKLRLLSAATLALTFAASGVAATISPVVHQQARTELQASYKAEREACDKLSSNAKDICVESAKGQEKVALAHLQYQRSGDAQDMVKLTEARYEARYEVAKEMCDDQSGNAKDVCVTQAKADHDKSKADAKLTKDVREARSDASDAKTKADFKVAQERCDAMSGDTKDACVAGARARFGQ